MEDRDVIIYGTTGLVAFNILLILIGSVAIKSLSVGSATVLLAPFTAAALYFDVKVIRYFAVRFGEKKNGRK